MNKTTPTDAEIRAAIRLAAMQGFAPASTSRIAENEIEWLRRSLHAALPDVPRHRCGGTGTLEFFSGRRQRLARLLRFLRTPRRIIEFVE